MHLGGIFSQFFGIFMFKTVQPVGSLGSLPCGVKAKELGLKANPSLDHCPAAYFSLPVGRVGPTQ